MQRLVLVLSALLHAGCAGTYVTADYEPNVVVERKVQVAISNGPKAPPSTVIASGAYAPNPAPPSQQSQSRPRQSFDAGSDNAPNPRRRTDDGIWTPRAGRQVWALVVGVGNYNNPKVPKLPYARKDAETFAAWFSQNALNGLNERENVRVLFDEQATRENLLMQIDWLRKKALPEDAVFVYFSCHGAPEIATDGNGVEAKYLLLADSDPDQLFSTGVSLDDLNSKLDAIKSVTQLVVIEACYSGGGAQSFFQRTPTADIEIRPRILQEMGSRAGRVILSASSGRQVAISSSEVGHGLFTYFLLQTWNNGAEPLVSKAMKQVKEKVRRAANELGSTQEPTVYGDLNIDVILNP